MSGRNPCGIPSYRVAMLMNEEITSWFNTEVFAGIESVMHNAGYDVSLFQHVDTAENRKEFFTNLPVRRNVDAVFVTSFGVDPKEIQQLKRIVRCHRACLPDRPRSAS